MTRCAPGARLFLLLLLVFSFVGCSQFKRSAVSEEKDPHFLEARKRAKAMDWDGAIEYFGRALQNNPTNAAAHFELGVLYDMRKQDYSAAIYHYERHMKLRPNTPSAERAEQNIVACKRELAKTVADVFVPRDLQKEMERYVQTNQLLSQQVTLLKTELAKRPQYVTNYVTNFVQVPQFEPGSSTRLTRPSTIVQAPTIANDVAEPELEPEPEPVRPEVAQPRQAARNTTPPTVARRNEPERPSSVRNASATTQKPAAARATHRVRPGDTLAAIASRYGVSIAALKAANPSARNGTRAGQTLIIPAR